MTVTRQLPDVLQLSNGAAVEFVIRDNEFLGIGDVSVDGVPIRCGERPWFVDLRTPDGVTLSNYRITGFEWTEGGGVSINLTPDALAGGAMEWMLHEVRRRIDTSDWTALPQPAEDTRLTIDLLPASRTIGGAEYKGLSYRFRYQSGSLPIYMLLERGTWEIGGRATGSEFWMRNCFVPGITRFDNLEQAFSTEWRLPDATNPNVFQFLPLQTELQGFSFTASEKGTLVTWATEIAHVRSLFEKKAGIDEIEHWHEHCADLSCEFAASPVEVLLGPGTADRVSRANAYEAVRSYVSRHLHSALGMEEERVAPYGMIEEWETPDFDRYLTGLEKLLDAGVQIVFIPNEFENNMNVWGISNMCCTVDYKVADSVGLEGLRRFGTRVKESGAQLEMWANTSISTTTLMFDRRNGDANRIAFLPREGSISETLDKAADPFVRNASGAIEADHYTPLFAVLNLRDPEIRRYWMSAWKKAVDDFGLGAIFLDSSFNLSSDKFHYVQNPGAALSRVTADQTYLFGRQESAPAPKGLIQSQYRAHLDLIRDMQNLGIHYCAEDIGVFGRHRHGPGAAMRLNCLHLWPESICVFDVREIEKTGANPDDVYFRALAYRMMWSIAWDIKRDCLSFITDGLRGDFDIPTPWRLDVYRAFGRVNDLMREREILPHEQGVLYRSGDGMVLWAFEDFGFPLAQTRIVVDVLDSTQTSTDKITARKHRIYIVKPVD